MRTLTGKAVSPGLAEGIAVVIGMHGAPLPARDPIADHEIDGEVRRLRDAVAASRDDLERLRASVAREIGESNAAIFATHVAYLADRSFIAGIEERIEREYLRAEEAVHAAASEFAGALARLDDAVLRERAQDVRDVARRLVGHLAPSAGPPLADLPEDTVVVAHELLPSETACLDRRHVRAIVTEEGSKTSHAAILAKALGVPAVTGVTGACARIRGGARLLVDGDRARVVVDPTTAEHDAFERDRAAIARANAAVAEEEGKACRTLDGIEIELHANLGRVGEAPDVRGHHLLGVGLLRTEVLFLESDTAPTLEAHETAYRRVAEALDGLPLVIRTLDLGADKRPRFLPPLAEHNPSIGLRGLRFALREIDLLRTQLAAILRVARDHPVRVLFPMVLAGDDLERAIEVMHEVAADERIASLPPVGAMIETPSSIFALPEIARACAFLSIGTNDLTQFMLAADRDAVDLLDEFSLLHPSVLRAIAMIVEHAAVAQRPVSLCGEAAGDPELAPLLVGLGLRSLSMSPRRAARVKMQLRRCRADDLAALAREALAGDSAATVRRLLRATLDAANAAPEPT